MKNITQTTLINPHSRAMVKYGRVIIGLAVLTTLIVALIVAQQPVKYESVFSITVTTQPPEGSTGYQYDGYYAVQASLGFAETVRAWLTSADVAAQIFIRTGVSPEEMSLAQLQKSFNAKQTAAQNIEVSYVSTTEDQASSLARSARGVLNDRVAAVNEVADSRGDFVLLFTDPVIIPVSSPWALYGLISGGLVIIIGFGLLLAGIAVRAQE